MGRKQALKLLNLSTMVRMVDEAPNDGSMLA